MPAFLIALLQAVIAFFTPIVVIGISLTVIIAFLLGALADPQGLMNQVICSAIDYVAVLFPSTPDELKVGSIIDSLGSSFPAFGRGLIREVFVIISSIFGLSVLIKIYKLLPFKAS